jgi:hypothetical protein
MRSPTFFVLAFAVALLPQACGGQTDTPSSPDGGGGGSGSSGGTSGGTGDTVVIIGGTTGTTPATTGGTSSVSSGGTSSGGTSGGGTSSGGSPDVLFPGPTGYVDDSATSGIVGGWYGYGDMWGINGAPPGSCQTLGMFADPQCSSIAFPMPSMFYGDGGTVATFPPNSTGAMCLAGTAAKVLTKGTIPDYADIWGIGIGLDFNNMGGTRLPWDATLAHVTGFSFDITGVPPGGVRVEFPTTQTTNGFQDSYSIIVTGDGHYQADLTTLGSDPHKLIPSFTPPTGMPEPAFDPTQLLSIQFHVPTNTTAAIAVPMMCVSNLAALIGP